MALEIVRARDDWPTSVRHGAVTIGNFDGVHRGHARILDTLRAQARELGGPAVVFTFDPHPVCLLRPDAAPPPLTWTERKAELLELLGIDVMIAYPTDERLLALAPTDFFQEVICEKLAARAVVEGPNFCFGRDRGGDVQLLGQLCRDARMALQIVEPLRRGDEFVSSSRVRSAIALGDVKAAREMLIRPYRIRGLVTHGAARGSRLGFPTANVAGIDTLLPAAGVYAGRAWVDGTGWPAAINLGGNPTFGEQACKLEVHLIGFHGSLYGRPLEVDFLDRLRDIRPFASVTELKEQLARDVQTTRELVTAYTSADHP